MKKVKKKVKAKPSMTKRKANGQFGVGNTVGNRFKPGESGNPEGTSIGRKCRERALNQFYDEWEQFEVWKKTHPNDYYKAMLGLLPKENGNGDVNVNVFNVTDDQLDKAEQFMRSRGYDPSRN